MCLYRCCHVVFRSNHKVVTFSLLARQETNFLRAMILWMPWVATNKMYMHTCNSIHCSQSTQNYRCCGKQKCAVQIYCAWNNPCSNSQVIYTSFLSNHLRSTGGSLCAYFRLQCLHCFFVYRKWRRKKIIAYSISIKPHYTARQGIRNFWLTNNIPTIGNVIA